MGNVNKLLYFASSQLPSCFMFFVSKLFNNKIIFPRLNSGYKSKQVELLATILMIVISTAFVFVGRMACWDCLTWRHCWRYTLRYGHRPADDNVLQFSCVANWNAKIVTLLRPFVRRISTTQILLARSEMHPNSYSTARALLPSCIEALRRTVSRIDRSHANSAVL